MKRPFFPVFSQGAKLAYVVVASLVALNASHAATLSLSFATNTISETNIGSATIATVSATPIPTNTLVVTIVNGSATELYLPASVTIPANFPSATFNVSAVNNPYVTGTSNVLVTVQASGYSDGSATLSVLDDDTPGYLTIGGYFSGVLSSNTYHVTGNLTVDYGNTLTIEPGGKLLFGSGLLLTNYGTLSAIGSAAAPILFSSSATSPSDGSWGGIAVTGSGTPQATLSNVEIDYAKYGLLVDPATNLTTSNQIVLSQSQIHDSLYDAIQIDCNIGFFFYGQAVQVVSNKLYQNGRYGLYLLATASGCDGPVWGSSNTATVVNNEIYANGNAGIELQGQASDACTAWRIAAVGGTIAGNYLHGNLYGIYGYAQSASGVYEDRPVHNWGRIQGDIQNNLIVSNQLDGLRLLNDSGADCLPTIANNTIVGNGNSGIYHSTSFTNESIAADLALKFIIANNLIVQNGWGIQAASNFVTDSALINGTNIFLVNNNDVWGNRTNNWLNYPSIYGNPISSNLNGTSADFALNISADPQFRSAGDYQLQPSSPVIDGGTAINTPTIDIAGLNRHGFPDLGCYEFTLLLSSPFQSNGSMQLTASGGRGTPLTLQSSTNLTAWTSLTNATLANRSITLTVPVPTNAPQMFYRAQLQ